VRQCASVACGRGLRVGGLVRSCCTRVYSVSMLDHADTERLRCRARHSQLDTSRGFSALRFAPARDLLAARFCVSGIPAASTGAASVCTFPAAAAAPPAAPCALSAAVYRRFSTSYLNCCCYRGRYLVARCYFSIRCPSGRQRPRWSLSQLQQQRNSSER
jgi:hypothetical protein